MPVSVLMGERAPGEKWTRKDTTLALALQCYEEGLCSGCGQPVDLTHSSDGKPGRGFEVHSFTCTACEELESISDETRKNDPPGTKRYTVLEED